MKSVAWSIALVSTGLSLLPNAAQANCAALSGLEYRVERGDTLYGITLRWLRESSDWRLLQRRNAIADPRKLRVGALITLPGPRLRLDTQAAVVEHVTGAVQTRPSGGATLADEPWQALQAGDLVREGAQLRVLREASASLRMPDGSVSVLSPQTEVRLEQLCNGMAGRFQVVRLRLGRGRIESTVQPLRGGSRFEVTTPQALASVRGTRFGVELLRADEAATSENPSAPETTMADVIEGHVNIASGRAITEVRRGFGIVVGAADTGAKALLPPPDLSPLPQEQLRTDLLIASQPVANAVRYRFRVARDAQFSNVLIDSAQATLPIRVVGLKDGDYHVSVRAENESGMPGLPASRAVRLTTSPEPPLLREPAAGQMVRDAVTLLCTEVQGSKHYAIQVAPDPDFRQPVVDETGLPGCRLSVPALPAGNWYWRAASYGPDGRGVQRQGPWSEPVSFGAVPPVRVPALGVRVSPDTGQDLHVSLGIMAGEVIELQVALDERFSQIVHTKTYKQSDIRLPLPLGHTYFLRVRAMDQHGFQSSFGATRVVTLGNIVKDGYGHPILGPEGLPIHSP